MHPFLLMCPFPTLLPASSVHSNGRGPAERTQKQRRERWSLHVLCRTFLSNAANGVPSGLSGEMDFSGLPRNSRIESLVIKRNRWHLGVKGGLFGIHTCCIHYRTSIHTVRHRGMGTGISQASKRVPIFSFATQGGKQESSHFRQGNYDKTSRLRPGRLQQSLSLG